VNLSVQLYTVRNQMAEDLRGTLAQIREIGYRYVEGGSLADRGVEFWQRTLAELDLKMSGMHVGIEALESDASAAIDEALAVDCPFLIVPWLPEDRRRDYASLARSLEEIGRQCRDRGVRLAYHNHDFELLDGGLDTLYGASDPDLVHAELDVAWVAIGGQDPVDWIAKLGPRASLIHLKDYDPAKTPVWQAAGQGVIDWDGVLRACDDAGVEFGCAELDEYDGNPIDALRLSYRFFASRGLS
jgi:sugar phosphate isomerase/epimerase